MATAIHPTEWPKPLGLQFRSSRDPACVASLALLDGGGTRSHLLAHRGREKNALALYHEFMSSRVITPPATCLPLLCCPVFYS